MKRLSKLFLLLNLFSLLYLSFAVIIYAQDATSNCVITNIGSGNQNSIPSYCQSNNSGYTSGSNGSQGTGTSLPTGSLLADRANELVNAAQTNCVYNNPVNWQDISISDGHGIAVVTGYQNCITNIIQTLNAWNQSAAVSGEAWYTDFYTGPNFFQCVGFVQTVLFGVQGSDGFTKETYAAQYANVNQPNYTYVSTNTGQSVSVGDIVIFGSQTDPVGHIAIAVKIVNNGFIVAEANFEEPGKLSNNRLVRNDDPTLLGWLHKN